MSGFLKKAFRGGIHPTDGADKALSKDSPIVKDYIPQVLEISMFQSPSGICEPKVKIGDHVTKGDIIATASNFTAVDLHASLSGIVENIMTYKEEKRPETVIRIIPDSLQPETESYKYNGSIEDISAYSPEDIINIMQYAGICGMGGAGFPTHVKFKSGKPIDYVLINASECESFLTCDYRMMLEYPQKIVNGANLMLKAANAKQAVICTEDNKSDCAKILAEICKSSENISVKVLPTRYPQGGERQLIQAVCSRQVPMNGLPADVGVIVSNVQTAKALCDAVFDKTPCISRAITVTGLVAEAKNFIVPIGTPIKDLIALCGGVTETNSKVVLGGPMTGNIIAKGADISTLRNTVTKVSGGVVILKCESIEENACIRCSKCQQVCPAGLTPWKIDHAERNDNLDTCEKLYATECIACGSCSWVCPAKREVSFHVSTARDRVKAAIRERGNK